MNEPDSLAGRGRRLLATLIDLILVPAVSFLIMLVSGVLEHAEDFAGNQWMLRVLGLGIAGYLLLNGYLLYRRGQTVGKLVMGVAIVNAEDDRVPPFWKLICIRALFFPLLYLPLGYAFAGPLTLLGLLDPAFIFRRSRRCLHDQAAGTRVIRRR